MSDLNKCHLTQGYCGLIQTRATEGWLEAVVSWASIRPRHAVLAPWPWAVCPHLSPPSLCLSLFLAFHCFVGACMPRLHMGVRGQLAGVCSLLHFVGSRLKLWSSCLAAHLYLLSRVFTACWVFTPLKVGVRMKGCAFVMSLSMVMMRC